MIYDCALYNGEKDLLKIRLEEMKSLDVLHILVELPFSFSGIDKYTYYWTPQCSTGFNNVLWCPLFEATKHSNPWDNEKMLRNSIADWLLQCNVKDDDIIIISDIDEIPRKEAILQFKPEMGVAFLDMLKFGFFLNLKEADHWTPPKIMSWAHLKNGTPEEIRNAGAPNTIDRGGWHFSWAGGIDEVMRKFASFSHQESEVQKHANREELIRKMAAGESLWGNDKWLPVPITELPQYVQDHQQELKHLIFHG